MFYHFLEIKGIGLYKQDAGDHTVDEGLEKRASKLLHSFNISVAASICLKN